MLQWVSANFGTVLELATLLGVSLIFISRLRNDLDSFKETTTAKWEEYDMELNRIDKRLLEGEGKYVAHLQELVPHKSCLVESAKVTDLTTSLAELRKDIKRVEGWLVALATKQGIKAPVNGDD